MADDPQKVVVDVEADATQATASARAAAASLAEVLATAGQLEARLRQVFTGAENANKELQKYSRQLQTVQTLPANMGNVTRTARNLATGGPTTALQNAAVQGVIATARADPAMQVLAVEKETNRVLEARETLYRRIRAALPEGTSNLNAVNAYRRGLTQLGAEPDKARTLAEFKTFEAKMADEREAAAARELRTEAETANRVFDEQRSFWARQERAEAEHFNRRYDQQSAASAKLVRKDAEDENRRLDQDNNFWAKQERQEAERLNRMFDQEQAAAAKRLRADAEAENRQFNRDRGINPNQKSAGEMFQTQARLLANYAVIGGALSGFGAATSGTIELQTALRQLQAITGSTNTEMLSLQATIFEVGQSTKFSTAEIANAATVMGQAGYSAEQIRQALPAIAQLATGAGATLDESVGAVTSILSQFNLSLDRTGTVSNQLAQALNSSKLEFTGLTQGIQYAGNAAAKGGVSFEELVSALGAMAQGGVKSGSVLGTGLRNIIESLENPSKKFRAQLAGVGLTMDDIDLKTNGLQGALENLNKAGFTGADAMEAFGIRAGTAYQNLAAHLDTMSQMQLDLVNTQAAAEAAGTQMNSLSSQVSRLMNALVQLTTSVGAPFLGMLQSAAGFLATLMVGASGAAPVFQLLATAMASLVAVSLAKWLIDLTIQLTGTSAAFRAFNVGAITSALSAGELGVAAEAAAVGVKGFTTALLANPVTIFALALTAITEAFFASKAAAEAANSAIDGYQTAADAARAKTEQFSTRVQEINGFVETLINHHAALSTNTTLAGQAAQTAAAKFGEWGLAVDSQSNKVDVLIGRLITLRGQMAATALEAVKTERAQLQQERGAVLAKANNPDVQRLAAGLATGGRLGSGPSLDVLRRTGALPLLDKLRQGPLSPDESLQLQSILRTNAGRLGGIQQADVRDLLGRLNTGDSLRLSNIDRRLGQLDVPIAENTFASSPQGVAAGQLAARAAAAARDRAAQIATIKDPTARLAAQVAARKQDIAGFPALQDQLRAQALEALKDPDVARGFQQTAAQQGRTPVDVAMDALYAQNPQLAGLRVAAQGPQASNNPKVLQTESARLASEAALAKKKKDIKGAQDALRRKKAIDDRIVELQNPDADPLDVQAMIDNKDATADNKIAGTGISRGQRGDPDARASAKTLGKQVEDIERRIDIAAAQLGPTGDDLLAGQDALKKLVDQRNELKRRQIKADATGSGANAQELKERLDAFESEAARYSAKILEGNIEAAKKLTAEAAERSATQGAARTAVSLRFGSDLDKGLASIQAGFDAALKAQIDASDETFRAKFGKDFDVSKSAEAADARRKLTQESAAKATAAILKGLDEFLTGSAERLADELRTSQRGIDRRRVHIAALGNLYGSEYLGDTHRALGEREGRQLDIEESGGFLKKARGDLQAETDANRSFRVQLDTATDADARNTFSEKIADSDAKLKSLRETVEKAQDAFDALTEHAKPFQTAIDAIRASWDAYVLNSHLNESVFEQLADNMAGVYDNARSSLASLVSDTLSGTKDMKTAFADFTQSVLKSLLDMISRMIANALLKRGLELIGSLIGGGFQDPLNLDDPAKLVADVPATRAIQGGYIGGAAPKRYAQGGSVTGGVPFRDSVSALLEPGEMVMNTSAVDLIGRDTLDAINGSANRRVEAMPTVQQAMPRLKPSTTNVWVVSPEQQPTLGKDDVLVTVGQDILTGGQLKRLVKAVASGAV